MFGTMGRGGRWKSGSGGSHRELINKQEVVSRTTRVSFHIGRWRLVCRFPPDLIAAALG